MNKSQIVNFIAFFKTFQLFWNRGCKSLRIGKSTPQLEIMTQNNDIMGITFRKIFFS